MSKKTIKKSNDGSTPSNDPTLSSLFVRERQGTCSICSDTNVALVNLSKNCRHDPGCCISCLQKDISSSITTKGTHRFQCPMPRCEVVFEPHEYYHLLNNKQTGLIDTLLLNRFLETQDEFRWCKSSKGCGAGQLVSNHGDLMLYYTCHACKQPLCFRHSIEWHTGFSCDEYDAERAANPNFASEAAVLEFTKQCPNELCHTPIMKAEGCDVITCCRFGTHACQEAKSECTHGGRNYCGQRFCWKCLGKIDINPETNAYVRHCNTNCEYASLNG